MEPSKNIYKLVGEKINHECNYIGFHVISKLFNTKKSLNYSICSI